jgi:hypothetical protein
MKGDTNLGLGVCRMSFNLKEKRMFLLTFERSVRCVVYALPPLRGPKRDRLHVGIISLVVSRLVYMSARAGQSHLERCSTRLVDPERQSRHLWRGNVKTPKPFMHGSLGLTESHGRACMYSQSTSLLPRLR